LYKKAQGRKVRGGTLRTNARRAKGARDRGREHCISRYSETGRLEQAKEKRNDEEISGVVKRIKSNM